MARPLKQPRGGGAPPGRDIGQALQRLNEGRYADARALCERLLERTPANRDALHLLGIAQLKLGQDGEAVRALERAAGIARGNAELLNNLATAYRRCGRLEDAIGAADRAIAIDGGLAVAHLNAALAHQTAGDDANASTRYRAALAADERLLAARRGLAELLRRTGQTEASVVEFDAALRADPDHAPTWNARGAALAAGGRHDPAIESFQHAIELDPRLAEAHSNLGNSLASAGRATEAMAHFERALLLSPDVADFHCNLGHALRRTWRDDAALDCYARALGLEPDSVEANFGAAVIHLSHGRFARGWRHYRGRDSMKSAPADLRREPLPADVRDRTIIALADQGLGDELFFLRFAPALRARGAAVAYRASPRLKAMLSRAPIVDHMLDPDEPCAGDWRVSVGDLPYLLGMADGDRPPPSIAIPPLPECEARMAKRLTALGPPPYIGLTWRAGTRGVARLLDKEVPHCELGRAVAVVPATYVSLQRAPGAAETEEIGRALGRKVHDLSDVNDRLEDMLALVGLFDEYVAVSNTNVHLRTARGRDSRVLVPSPPEFRWMATGSESPWFPGTRLYRQSSTGDWSAALVALAADLGYKARQ